ncbi:MAG TPA: adenylate/guanylate cyclase domain-containing protein, partial [Thermoanaerobaculia bacterium]|nr:adenylate/guanylate cyclase domain-containing protein [Thermoanaerobaculia bacterium]
PDDSRAYYLAGNGLVRLGERDEGVRFAERALHIHPDEEAVLYNVACDYALAGESERAFECLERAVEIGFGNSSWLEIDPDLDTLRRTARFEQLVERLAASAKPFPR